MSEIPLVLVTGMSGFIGSWVGYAALKQGYRVRGTVRSLENKKKVHHLQNLCPDAKYPLELVEADLTSDTGWDEAVKDCTYILHVASPFPIQTPKDKNEIIKPAVEGTLSVLRATSRRDIPPKRVVITSSVIAMFGGHDDRTTKYTDDTWTILNDPKYPVGAYGESKTLAERAAWDFVASLPEEKRFELSTVNPSFVLGPLLSTSDCSSVEVIKKILMGDYPALPNITLDIVSVFDVAKAHLLAMTHPQAAGKRFMVHGTQLSMPEVSDVLVKEFRQWGYYPSVRRVPHWILYIASYFDERTKSLLPMVDVKKDLHPSNARDILGMTVDTDGPKLIKWIAYGAIKAGLIPDRSPDKTISANYVLPELDMSGVPRAEEL